jgi:hypothetical protein
MTNGIEYSIDPSHQAAEAEGQRRHPQLLHQPPAPTVRTKKQQQVEAEHGRRQHQRQRRQGLADDTQTRARHRQPPGQWRAQEQQRYCRDARKLERYPKPGQVVSGIEAGTHSLTW